MSALSVSISAMISPPSTRSPSFLIHLMTLPLSMASESLGITTLVMGMSSLRYAPQTRRMAAMIFSLDGVFACSRFFA